MKERWIILLIIAYWIMSIVNVEESNEYSRLGYCCKKGDDGWVNVNVWTLFNAGYIVEAHLVGFNDIPTTWCFKGEISEEEVKSYLLPLVNLSVLRAEINIEKC